MDERAVAIVLGILEGLIFVALCLWLFHESQKEKPVPNPALPGIRISCFILNIVDQIDAFPDRLEIHCDKYYYDKIFVFYITNGYEPRFNNFTCDEDKFIIVPYPR